MTSIFPSARTVVWQNAHFTVELDKQNGIIWTIRSSTPYASFDELEAVMHELGRVLDGLGRSRHALVADVRAAPGRNDPEFEAVMYRLRPLWLKGFRRVGVLVQTVVGAMQVQRFAKQDGIERLITSDEAELMRYVMQTRSRGGRDP